MEQGARISTVREGVSRASAELLPLVYEQLRALAGRKMRQEHPDQTLQATALVHEVYLRLVDTTKVQVPPGVKRLGSCATCSAAAVCRRGRSPSRRGGTHPLPGIGVSRVQSGIRGCPWLRQRISRFLHVAIHRRAVK
jgi:hypothetical protein